MDGTPFQIIPYVLDNVRSMSRRRFRAPNQRPAGARLARLTSKGQLTVPKDVRTFMDLRPGDTVLFSMLGPKVTMERLPRMDEVPRLEIPEHLRDLTPEQEQELLDEGHRRRWREKTARDRPTRGAAGTDDDDR